MELLNNNFRPGNTFIDRFKANISSVGQSRQICNGIFDVAAIDITAEIVCEPEFTSYCETLQVFDNSNSTTIPSVNLSLLIATPLTALAISALVVAAIALSLFVCLRMRKSKRLSITVS